MAQTYTLDEAATRLGISPEEFKRRLRDDWKSVRSFRDGATLRFRAADIDELARALGQASDPGLPLGDSSPLHDSSHELSLTPPTPKPMPKPGKEAPLYVADDSDDIFSLPSNGGPKSKPKSGGKGDSDVRLDSTPRRADAGGNQPTEEIELDLPPASGVGLGKSSAKLTAPKSSSGKMNKIPGPKDSGGDDGSSEFELSLDSDSDSFELQLNNDSSEESALGGDLPTSGGAQSGINLGRPSDSGVNLEKKGSKPPMSDDSDGDFELALDTPSGGPKSKPIPSAGGKGMDAGSSEFELTLDDSDSESMNQLAADVQQEGDIFETDFELPVMSEDESGSEVLQVDSADTDLENSDFDLAIDPTDAPADDESASQVVLMDDEEPLVDEEPVALEEEPMVVEDDEEDAATALGGRSRGPVRTEVVEKVVAPPPPKWGIVPILALAPTFLLVVLGGLMAYEVVTTMNGSAQKAPISRGVAGMFGMKTGD